MGSIYGYKFEPWLKTSKEDLLIINLEDVLTLVESKDVENMLFSGKRVTSNILKGTDQIPEDFGRADGVMKSGLADITLESRKELKETIAKLANIILKKEELKVENADEDSEYFKKTDSTSS